MNRKIPLRVIGIFLVLWTFLMIIMMWVDDAFDDDEIWSGVLFNCIIAAVCLHYSQKNSRPHPDNIEEHKKEQKQNKENKQDSSLEILKKRYAGGEISEEEFNKIKEDLE
jgi:hypothetical protein